jgi:hypothetical protein
MHHVNKRKGPRCTPERGRNEGETTALRKESIGILRNENAEPYVSCMRTSKELRGVSVRTLHVRQKGREENAGVWRCGA